MREGRIPACLPQGPVMRPAQREPLAALSRSCCFCGASASSRALNVARIAPVVRKVSPRGTITAFAGTGETCHVGEPCALGDGGPATEAKLFPTGVAADTTGNVYISDGGNRRVRKSPSAGGVQRLAQFQARRAEPSSSTGNVTPSPGPGAPVFTTRVGASVRVSFSGLRTALPRFTHMRVTGHEGRDQLHATAVRVQGVDPGERSPVAPLSVPFLPDSSSGKRLVHANVRTGRDQTRVPHVEPRQRRRSHPYVSVPAAPFSQTDITCASAVTAPS